jgi:hypothetical protein
MFFCMGSSHESHRKTLFVSLAPNPISIDTSRAFASAGDPLTATRDTRHGAYDPNDAISSAFTSFAEDSQPRSPTTGVGLARVRGGPGGVPFILRLRCAALARGRWRPRRTDGPRRSRPLTRRRRRILRRHRRDTVARRAVGGVSSRASATSRHARVFFRSRCGRVFHQPTRRLVSLGRDASRARDRGRLAAAGHTAVLARVPSPRQRGRSRHGGRTARHTANRNVLPGRSGLRRSVVDRDRHSPPSRANAPLTLHLFSPLSPLRTQPPPCLSSSEMISSTSFVF